MHVLNPFYIYLSILLTENPSYYIYHACKTYHLITYYDKIYQLNTLSSNTMEYIYFSA